MKLLFCVSFFSFFFYMNINEVSTIPPIRPFDCSQVLLRACPLDKPYISCLYKRCPPGWKCCYDGCYPKCFSSFNNPIDQPEEPET
ncbi:UNVERIFIED_CONTAM: hypothetical protein RMT77_019026 [Armadillidium vulgare]